MGDTTAKGPLMPNPSQKPRLMPMLTTDTTAILLPMPTTDTMDIILDTLTTDTTDTHMLMLDTTTAKGPLMLTLRLMPDTFMVTMDTDTTSDMPTMDSMDTHMPTMDTTDTTTESNPLMDIIINLKFFKN